MEMQCVLSSAPNKVHILTFCLFNFLNIRPSSNVRLPEGTTDTAWEPPNQDNFIPSPWDSSVGIATGYGLNEQGGGGVGSRLGENFVLNL
jgi:hypothetical protein